MLKVGDMVTINDNISKTVPNFGKTGEIIEIDELDGKEFFNINIRFSDGFAMRYKEIELQKPDKLIQVLLEVIK